MRLRAIFPKWPIKMEKDKRSGIDLLRDVEHKIDAMLAYIRNIDNVQKILLARMNDQSPVSVPSPAPKTGKVTFDQLPKTNKFEQMKAKAGVVDEPGEPGELVQATNPQGSARRGQRAAPPEVTAEVSVSQLVLYPTGKPVFAASVEIIDTRGLLVEQVRTQPNGRWNAKLAPGKYVVRIVKRVAKETMAKPIDVRYDIEIPAGVDKHVLDSPTID